MSTSINTNLASLFAQNSLSGAQNRLADSVQRLSSGLRINSAKDDAAGLAIAQNMQSQINGVNQSIRNLSDATNLIQTAESSLATIQDMLLRMKQLSTQGYNGSLSATQKNAIVNEVKDLNSEINATAVRTQFNGINLLSTGQGVDAKTGDIYAGQYLTETTISITSSANNLAASDSFDISDGVVTVTNNGAGTGTSTYNITLDNDSFKRDMVGTYNFTSYDDSLILTFEDADTGKISQQTITVNAALGDGPDAKTTTQELDFSKFGIKLTLQNTIDAGDSDALGESIASAFNGKTIVVDGQSSQITAINLSGTESTTYTLTNVSGATTLDANENSVVTWAALVGGESVTIAGVTVNNTGTDSLAVADLKAIFDGLTAGTAVSVDVDDGANLQYNASGTLEGYDVVSTPSFLTTKSTFTSVSDGINVADLAITDTAGTAYTVVTTDYVAASSNGSVKLTYTDNSGVSHEETVDLVDANFSKNSDTYINFGDAGISIKIHNYQEQTGKQIATQLAALYGIDGDNTDFGTLKVLQSTTSQLNFQSGPSTEAYIAVQTLNVMTGSEGVTEGSADQMKTVGTLITSDLESLNSSNTDAEWQAVFSSLGAAIDDAIDYISTERAVYGSQINRLSFMTTNLQANSTNLQSSRSSIIDTDFAAETAALTKGQIMQQAATAMLAQANQMPNVILSLLK
jgi:flagellin